MTGHGDFLNLTTAELSQLKGNPEGTFEIRDYRESRRFLGGYINERNNAGRTHFESYRKS